LFMMLTDSNYCFNDNAEVDGMLLDLYNEENFHKMYKYDIERAKAEAAEAEARADAAEAELKKLQEEVQKLREQIPQ
ncbi:MAG: hypothetical protein K5654_01905, partial [Lachnospiraceae bacterium]|nr:hypothetical protein [Lachnospiraceae bacterium]